MIRSSVRVLVLAGALTCAQSAATQTTVLPDAAPPAATPEAPKSPKPTPAQTTEPQAAAPEAPTPPPSSETPSAEPAAPPPPAPAPVQMESLDQLDLFSTGRDTGLGQDVWRGASADIARAVIPTLGSKPLSLAGDNLARRLLAQAATAPEGAGADLGLAVARARALLTLGDAEDASLVMDRTPGVADHADLSQLAAEAALIGEQDDKACRIADNLTDGRDGLYWLRLRAFCQARAGKADEAQLIFNLAGPRAKDVTTARLLSAYIAAAGDPGPASLHTGLGFALSRALKLDFGPAMPTAAPAIRHHLWLKSPTTDIIGGPVIPVQPEIAEAEQQAAADKPNPKRLFDQLEHETSPGARVREQAAITILAGLGGEMSDVERARFDDFEVGRSETPAVRLMALSVAAEAGLKGETALLSLQIAQAGGAAGPAPADRYWIIRALERVGLKTYARDFAVEGLQALSSTR